MADGRWQCHRLARGRGRFFLAATLPPRPDHGKDCCDANRGRRCEQRTAIRRHREMCAKTARLAMAALNKHAQAVRRRTHESASYR